MDMIPLDIAMLMALFAVYVTSFWGAPRFYAWNRDARWVRLSWYVPPEEGSFRAWLECPRPRLHRLGAWMVTKLFLISLRGTAVALMVAIAVH